MPGFWTIFCTFLLFYFLIKVLGKIENKRELFLKLFRPFIILAEKNDIEDNGIEPLYNWRIWNDLGDLTERQVASYRFVANAIRSGGDVDLVRGKGYLSLFLFESSKSLLGGKHYISVISDLQKLKLFCAEDSGLLIKCDKTIAAIYLCFGEPDKYINIMEKYINCISDYDCVANCIINVKYLIGECVGPKELFGVKNKLTKYGRENIDAILSVANNSIASNNEFWIDLIEKTVKRNVLEGKFYNFNLFDGNPYSYSLNQRLLPKKYKNRFISFCSDVDFKNKTENFSRECENLFRVSKGIPKVGEGWVNETKLYYDLKSYFENYTLIHQYRTKWLGLQSIDIFIEEYNIGIEYQGIQHYRPVEFFGGEDGFKKTKERDERKKFLCKSHAVCLIYVNEGYDFQFIINQIRYFQIQFSVSVSKRNKKKSVEFFS